MSKLCAYARHVDPNLPTLNLYWRQILPSDVVSLTPNHWAYTVTRDGKSYLVNWSGHESHEARQFLDSRAKKDQS